jgi:hypothetical protein
LLLLTAAAVIFVNVVAAVFLLPQLAKIFTGYENEWTRRSGEVFNLNLFAIAVGLTWLVMDPLMQAYFAVRCFYKEARTNGRDLLVRLRHLAALAVIALAIGSSAAAHSQTMSGQPISRQAISGDELDRSLARVLQDEEFGWQHAQKAAKGNFFLDRIAHDVTGVMNRIGSWVSTLGNWIRKLAGENRVVEKERAHHGGTQVQWWMYSIGAVILLAMLIALFRRRQPAGPAAPPETGADVKEPDLSDTRLLASDMGDGEWLRLAREYVSSGDLRLAVRAMYLSNLAYLAARQLIAIAESKSNGIYERELRLRARADAISTAFAMANRGFERAWYGLHEVTPESIEAFEHHIQAIRQHA